MRGRRTARVRTQIHTDHGLHDSASLVLTATGPVNGKWQTSTPAPYRIDTPQPIAKKFVTGDYVGNSNVPAKLGANKCPRRASAQMGEIQRKLFYLYSFFRDSYDTIRYDTIP